jgi:hypothetical protein
VWGRCVAAPLVPAAQQARPGHATPRQTKPRHAATNPTLAARELQQASTQRDRAHQCAAPGFQCRLGSTAHEAIACGPAAALHPPAREKRGVDGVVRWEWIRYERGTVSGIWPICHRGDVTPSAHRNARRGRAMRASGDGRCLSDRCFIGAFEQRADYFLTVYTASVAAVWPPSATEAWIRMRALVASGGTLSVIVSPL